MSTHGEYDTRELRAYIDKVYDGDTVAFLSDFIQTLDKEQLDRIAEIFESDKKSDQL